MSLNALIHLPLSSNSTRTLQDAFLRPNSSCKTQQKQKLMVVEAKGKRGMQARQFQRAAPPPLPKIEDDGNPRFVIFIRTAKVSTFLVFSLPLSSLLFIFFCLSYCLNSSFGYGPFMWFNSVMLCNWCIDSCILSAFWVWWVFMIIYVPVTGGSFFFLVFCYYE